MVTLKNVLKIFSEYELNKIMEDVYKIIEKIGILVKNKKISDLLVKNGAKNEDGVIKVSRDIVKECISKTPKNISFSDRKCNIFNTEKKLGYLGTMSDAIEILDSENMHARSADKSDLMNLTKIADYLKEVDFIGLQVVPSGGEGLFSQLDAMKIILQNTNKPLFLEPLEPFILQTWIEIEEIIKDLEIGYKGPSIFTVVCPLSPLRLDDSNSMKLLLCAKNNIPVFIAPCPIAGLTSPFTLAGTISQSLVEAFFMLTVLQLAENGSPAVLSCASTVMDLKTGSVTYGTPEFALLMLALVEIYNYLELPSYTPIMGPDSEELDAQTGAEMMQGFMTLFSNMPNFMAGVGSLNKTRIASYEKLLIDIEIFKMAARVYQGIKINERTLAYENISKIRTNKNYLMDELTITECRSGEQFIPDILNREMKGKGSKNMFSRAKEKVNYILNEHKPDVSNKILNELEKFFLEKKKEIKKFKDLI